MNDKVVYVKKLVLDDASCTKVFLSDGSELKGLTRVSGEVGLSDLGKFTIEGFIRPYELEMD